MSQSRFFFYQQPCTSILLPGEDKMCFQLASSKESRRLRRLLIRRWRSTTHGRIMTRRAFQWQRPQRLLALLSSSSRLLPAGNQPAVYLQDGVEMPLVVVVHAPMEIVLRRIKVRVVEKPVLEVDQQFALFGVSFGGRIAELDTDVAEPPGAAPVLGRFARFGRLGLGRGLVC
ncbi:hypothetical protein Trco_003364 [Trichoderma cornu-damae]|uniref:Uncharacterized protein n=1 Tax=Trichoderma cornu-damae TaxID=654480 RepID=A0A9P8QKX6_9HYPO|nr:hypothetical protein Trco_003364 [Trichoderma cornu-damae]